MNYWGCTQQSVGSRTINISSIVLCPYDSGLLFFSFLFSKQPPLASHNHYDNSCRTNHSHQSATQTELHEGAWAGELCTEFIVTLGFHGGAREGGQRAVQSTGFWVGHAWLWFPTLCCFPSVVLRGERPHLSKALGFLFNANNKKPVSKSWWSCQKQQNKKPEAAVTVLQCRLLHFRSKMQSPTITMIMLISINVYCN